MTTNGNEITAMGLFRDGLDRDIKTKEDALRNHLLGLQGEIARALKYLDEGYRVNSCGVCQGRATEIDQLCATIRELHDVRNGLNAAIEHDAKEAAK
jgi:hypothetical protein